MLPAATLLPIIAAGLMNGSFVIPAKYIKNVINEKIWLRHSIIGLGIIPWIIMAATMPQVIPRYFSLSDSVLAFLIFGGMIFGAGQLCFAYAIEAMGIALSFAVNLGVGVTIGSLFVTFYHTSITTESYTVILAVFLILSSLVMYYYAGKKEQTAYTNTRNYRKGWVLASLAGLASGFQNITFVIVAFHTKTQFESINSFWVWPPFLFSAAIIMGAGFFYQLRDDIHQFSQSSASKIKNLFLVILMGLFFTGSLELYSSGMNKLTTAQQAAGWPAFMISIILTSQMWGYLYRESGRLETKNKCLLFFSVLLLMIAIIILALKGG